MSNFSIINAPECNAVNSSFALNILCKTGLPVKLLIYGYTFFMAEILYIILSRQLWNKQNRKQCILVDTSYFRNDMS